MFITVNTYNEFYKIDFWWNEKNIWSDDRNKTTIPLWPSSSWFIVRVLAAASPLIFGSSTVTNVKITSKPSPVIWIHIQHCITSKDCTAQLRQQAVHGLWGSAGSMTYKPGKLGQTGLLFTTLHGMQTRSSDEKAVCPSIHPSVCQTCGLWQNGRKICMQNHLV